MKLFGRKYLGGETGLVAVLHTWGQDLGVHIHLHCIKAGGALSAERTSRKAAAEDFLLPVVGLSAHFRDSFCDGLGWLFNKGELKFVGLCAELAAAEKFEEMLTSMRGKSWEVYARLPFGGPERVFDHQGPYVHRGAISNH